MRSAPFLASAPLIIKAGRGCYQKLVLTAAQRANVLYGPRDEMFVRSVIIKCKRKGITADLTRVRAYESELTRSRDR